MNEGALVSHGRHDNELPKSRWIRYLVSASRRRSTSRDRARLPSAGMVLNSHRPDLGPQIYFLSLLDLSYHIFYTFNN